MIIGNTIKFGYGDVVVRSCDIRGVIIFTNVKPPQEIGEKLTSKYLDSLEVGLEVTLTEDKPHELYKLIRGVSKENPIVEYKGWKFDFTNYNEESVRIVKEHAFDMVWLQALSC